MLASRLRGRVNAHCLSHNLKDERMTGETLAILMPGDMNGRELADWAVRKYPNLKVLLTTAAEKETELHMHGNKVFDMLHKPYSKQDLLKHIHAIL